MCKRLASLGAAAAVALALTACTNDTEEPGIAQLDDADGATEAAADAGTAEEQALAFAQCMRDNGVDFPDPTVDAEGNPSFEGAFGRGEEGGFDPGDTSFMDAMEACGDLMEGLAFGGAGDGGFDQEGITEALYAYTSCLRDEGLDVGDITLDGMMPGGAPGGDGGAMPTLDPGQLPDGPPAGVQGGGADPTDRFAEQLGQDPDSAEWIAASEACQSLLDDALGGFGMQGGPGGQGADA